MEYHAFNPPVENREMKKIVPFVIMLIIFLAKPCEGYSKMVLESNLTGSAAGDSIRQSMILYNGRIWQNLWYMIEGDQFLFSNDFLPGTLTMRGKTFRNIRLKVDVFKDEVLIPAPGGGILQVNKEMVDSFSFVYHDKTYHFLKSTLTGPEEMTGYVSVLYSGKTSLCIKYFKKTEPPRGEGDLDRFYQGIRIMVIKDNIPSQIKSKKDLLVVFKDHSDQLKSYIKKNRLAVSGSDPESFIPVLRYYDSISN